VADRAAAAIYKSRRTRGAGNDCNGGRKSQWTHLKLYRVPPRPGFLGGFDAKPFVFSLLCAGGLQVATQYLAWSFGYQPGR
jgi:hypothetical protein